MALPRESHMRLACNRFVAISDGITTSEFIATQLRRLGSPDDEVWEIRHLDVEDLWVQAKVREKVVELVKVPGSDNPADCLTKYVDRAILTKMLKLLGMRIMEGRSSAAPELPPDPTLTPA